MSAPHGELFGPYTVYELIGQGGMATVHRAEITGLAGFRKAVALKRMLPSIAANEEFVRSFVREGRLASYLRHGNVAQTYDLGKVDDVYFIAMELVTGRTLRDILRHAYEAKSRIPVPVALHILNQICDALDYAHNLCSDSGAPLGIIHRDVSPSNIIVSDAGIVKLIDFGIAKASSASLQMQTMTGVIKGKFSYIAPEYIAGQIDARADLFAVGILAHELMTGNPLFKGKDDMDTLNRVQTMEIVPPSAMNPDIPKEIDAIVMTALQRDPELRWQRASALRLALTTELSRLGMTTSDRQLAQWVQTTTAAPIQDAEPEMQAPTRLIRVGPATTPVARDSGPSIVVEYASTTDNSRSNDGITNVIAPRLPRASSPDPDRPTTPRASTTPARSATSMSPASPVGSTAPMGSSSPASSASMASTTPMASSSPVPMASSASMASTAPMSVATPPPTTPRPSATPQPFGPRKEPVSEPQALPPPPMIPRPSDEVPGLRTIPHYGTTIPRYGRAIDRAHPAPRPPDHPRSATNRSILFWIGIAAAATLAVIFIALPFLL